MIDNQEEEMVHRAYLDSPIFYLVLGLNIGFWSGLAFGIVTRK
jgi:hypothetical protein